MNKALLKIADKAGLELNDLSPDDDVCFSMSDLDNFANLIIQECISSIDELRDPMTLNYSPKSRAIESIRMRFGL